MIKSMTGFGRGETTLDGKTFLVEIRSVNHRYNDISIKMPRFLSILEDKVREFIQSHMSRGKIDVFISYNALGLENKQLIFDEQLAEEYVDVLNKIKLKFEISDLISLSLISRFPDIIRIENKDDQEELWDILKIALQQAIGNAIRMRENEGDRLRKDILKRLDIIKSLVNNIELRASSVVEEYRQRLNNRIKDMVNINVDEQRLATEVAIMSDKSSIDEEITRLYSHISQMTDTLNSSEPVGRKLDFIVQEINRESNTINSKVSNIEIINNVIEIKTELEKIREQIQNIE